MKARRQVNEVCRGQVVAVLLRRERRQDTQQRRGMCGKERKGEGIEVIRQVRSLRHACRSRIEKTREESGARESGNSTAVRRVARKRRNAIRK